MPVRQAFETGEYPYSKNLKRKVYEKEKAKLQAELLKVQHWVRETGQKVIIVFEGRDAAGKGGTITRFMEHLNPRAARVVALDKPTERERGNGIFSATSNRRDPGLRVRGFVGAVLFLVGPANDTRGLLASGEYQA